MINVKEDKNLKSFNSFGILARSKYWIDFDRTVATGTDISASLPFRSWANTAYRFRLVKPMAVNADQPWRAVEARQAAHCGAILVIRGSNHRLWI